MHGRGMGFLFHLFIAQKFPYLHIDNGFHKIYIKIYMFSCSELGTEAEEVETNFEQVLEENIEGATEKK